MAQEGVLAEAVLPGAGPILFTKPDGQRVVIIFLGGLGTTKEKMGWGHRRKIFEAAGHAVILADHYNEGARRDKSVEQKSNRGGWAKCQKDLFWRAIHNTALTVPEIVDFALSTYGNFTICCGYGASMGGDIFLVLFDVDGFECLDAFGDE